MTNSESGWAPLRKRLLTGLLAALVIDALVLAWYWVPSMLGHVGSESHEWTALAVGLATGGIGLLLVTALVIVYCIRTRKGPPVDS